jgi:hypothetical protein
MTNVTVDNDPVSVVLGDNETFTPASGTVVDVTIAADDGEAVIINGKRVMNQGGKFVSYNAVLTDSDTVEDRGIGRAVHITGYVVSK